MTFLRPTPEDEAPKYPFIFQNPDCKTLHRVKLLLKLYRHVVWSVENNLYDVGMMAYDFGSRRIQELIDYLAFDLEGEFNTQKVGDYLQSITKSKELIKLIDKALIKLNAYPENGEIYFYLLNNKFIFQHTKSDKNLMEAMDLSRPTYYRRKKEAIEILGTIIWGFLTPDILASFQCQQSENPIHTQTSDLEIDD